MNPLTALAIVVGVIFGYIRKQGTGGAPQEGNSFMVDLSLARPFTVGEYNFSVEGHIEYIGGRKNRFGDDVRRWLLAQPQLRWNVTGRLSLGIEINTG